MTKLLLVVLLLIALWYYSNYNSKMEKFEHLDVDHYDLLQSTNVVPQQQGLPQQPVPQQVALQQAVQQQVALQQAVQQQVALQQAVQQQVAPQDNKYKEKYMHQIGSCQMDTIPSDVQSLMHSDLSMAAAVKQNRDNFANFTKVTSQSSDTLPNSVDKLAELRTTTNPEDSLRTCGRKISDVYNNLVSPQLLLNANEKVSGFESLSSNFMAL